MLKEAYLSANGQCGRNAVAKTEDSVFAHFGGRVMPKLKENQIPSYRLHKQSGQAIVTLSGKDHLLGTYGSAASKEMYKRLTAEWLAGGGAALNAVTDLTVVELIRDFLVHAKLYYRHVD